MYLAEDRVKEVNEPGWYKLSGVEVQEGGVEPRKILVREGSVLTMEKEPR